MQANFVNFVLCPCDFSPNFRSKVQAFRGISSDISLEQRPQFGECLRPKRKFAIIIESSSVIHEISEAIERQVTSVCGIETIGVRKMRRFFAALSFETIFCQKALKSTKICRNSFALLLHNTVTSRHTSKTVPFAVCKMGRCG